MANGKQNRVSKTIPDFVDIYIIIILPLQTLHPPAVPADHPADLH